MSVGGSSNATLDVDERIAKTGCTKQYGRLDDCLDKYNREWKQCQVELKDFARCMKEYVTSSSSSSSSSK